MTHLVVAVLGVIAGATAVYVALQWKHHNLQEQKEDQDRREVKIQESLKKMERFKNEKAEFDLRVISFKELEDENSILKRDLQNIDVNLRKIELDRNIQQEKQEGLDRRGGELGRRYLADNIKWITASLTPNNFVTCKKRLQTAIDWCRKIDFAITAKEETGFHQDLKAEFQKTVRAALEREEQARIKAQIREEQKLEKEIERELERLERECSAIQAALDKALAEAKDEHGAEVELLRQRLAEAEEKSQRAKSRAQMTRAGHVYVISNVGSFGDGVFKIGMTRRLDPMDRVKELGDASVPFGFDVHMMLSSDDAPALESVLHRHFHRLRVNKVNPRKEFFKTTIDSIATVVRGNHGEVEYVADAEALEYRQSMEISEEDQDFLESTFNQLSRDTSGD